VSKSVETVKPLFCVHTIDKISYWYTVASQRGETVIIPCRSMCVYRDSKSLTQEADKRTREELEQK